MRCAPSTGQIDDLVGEINKRSQKDERVLVTTLTKKMAEDLTAYFENLGIRVRYMHHDVETIERMEIIRDLRLGEFDVLVGINLLREGLDIPGGFARRHPRRRQGGLSAQRDHRLIQTIGRAARNADGMVIMYADTHHRFHAGAPSDETNRRRAIQYGLQRARTASCPRPSSRVCATSLKSPPRWRPTPAS